MITQRNVSDLFQRLDDAVTDLGNARQQVQNAMDEFPAAPDWPSPLDLNTILEDIEDLYGTPTKAYDDNQLRKLRQLKNVLASANIDTIDKLIEYVER
tara:strand:- start:237 stop:530 length:294 start_codon:yes stop_codon:yes gene_type:complete